MAGLPHRDYELKVFYNDWDFDKFAEKIFSSGKYLLVDPTLDKSRRLVKGKFILDENLYKKMRT